MPVKGSSRVKPGAAKRAAPGVAKRTAFKIADPNGLVSWLGKDRAMVTLGAGRDIPANRNALETIVRAWIKQL